MILFYREMYILNINVFMMRYLIIVFLMVFIFLGIVVVEKFKLFILLVIGSDMKFCGNESVFC